MKKFIWYWKITIFVLLFLLLPITVKAAFSDVPKAHFASDAINYVQSQKIIEGYADNTFQPEKAINRAEFTTIIIRSLGEYKKEKNCFQDVKEEWFSEFICAAKSKGIIAGYADQTFHPEKTINFAEASKIVTNAFALPKPKDDPNVWYASYIQTLEQKAAIPIEIKKIDEPLTRALMAEIIYRIHAKVENKPSKKLEDFTGQIQKSPIAGVYSKYDVEKIKTAFENNQKVILFFYAEWCPFCRKVDQDIWNRRQQIPYHVNIFKVDYDTATDLKKAYEVAFPQSFVQIDKSQKKIKAWIGSGTLSDLLEQIQ